MTTSTRPIGIPRPSVFAGPGLGLSGCFALSLMLALGATGCGGDDGGDAETETTSSEPGVTFTLDAAADSLCGATTDRIEFATRRVACWDPELPCTSPAVPFWIVGTTVSCAGIGSDSRTWEIAVEGAGQYETQLRALTGDTQEGVHCYAAGADDLTRVTREDLELQTTFGMAEIADDQCSNP